MILKSFAAGLVLAVGVNSAVSAASVSDASITSITAQWIDPVPTDGISIDNSASPITISWGVPESNGPQSGYSFESADSGLSGISAGDLFTLGTYTHFNNPVFGTTLEKVSLSLNIQGVLDDTATAFDVNSVFDFVHLETTNVEPCPIAGSLSVCDDLVKATLNKGASTSISVDGIDYFFNVEGFESGGDFTESFLTQEQADNVAALKGSFKASTDINPVPVPAALPMLLSAFAVAGWIGRRRSA